MSPGTVPSKLTWMLYILPLRYATTKIVRATVSAVKKFLALTMAASQAAYGAFGFCTLYRSEAEQQLVFRSVLGTAVLIHPVDICRSKQKMRKQ